MKSLLFLIVMMPLLSFAQLAENDSQISFFLSKKSEADLFYQHLNLKESLVKNPAGGMHMAKIYQDPTGALTIRCDLLGELQHNCQIMIQKKIENQNIQYQDDEKYFAVILLDSNEIEKLWTMIDTGVMDHGAFQYKVLANDSSDFSVMCLRNSNAPEKTMCQAQVLR